MIKTLIIDDEPLALQQLAVYVSKVPFLTLVGECQSALEARDIINSERVDVIFIDINMPDLNGMDFVRSLIGAAARGLYHSLFGICYRRIQG